MFFWFFFVFFFFKSKSAQVGLRLPDCTHIYSNKGFYSIYNLDQGEKGGVGEKGKKGKNIPPPLPHKKREKNPTTGRSSAKHNGRVCSPKRWFCTG